MEIIHMVDQFDTQTEPNESSNSLLSGLRRILMASIGAVVLAQEEIEEFINKMVERGEIADGDARNLVSDVLDRRKRLVQDGTKTAEGELDKRIESLLQRMNIPTKTDIELLNANITELSHKVDDLTAGRVED
jgi:poly(hydroxyalkanoate) granule-associated protein